uniref:Odorant receptor n=1 Tax=Vespula pensylvanica TaxID=30213 RepID=A0A834MWC6_VESPE|nr:hypothetical protein H0235_018442 [Vespula pensylvanica]
MEIGIANVRRSFLWSSRYLRCMGIWPVKNYVPLFLFFFTYLIVHCSLTFAHLLLAPKTVDNILSNLAENIELTMTLTKVAITRMNREALRKLFTEIKQFSLTEKYETKQEKLTLLNYTKLPLYFITIITSSMTLTEVLYYTNGVSIGIQTAKKNNSLGYQLPYKTIEIVDLKDYRIYALFCAYQLMFIPSIVLGYVGFDYMFVNLSIQVIAQFAILSCKVKTILNHSKNCHEGMKELSTNFGKAIYDYEWYNLSATDAKLFLMCMIRTQKPQCLTSGKFAILSLTIFTDQNSSIGYKLPYKTLEIMDLKDSRTYALICAYQILFVPCVVLGYVGFDYMFVNLSIQVIAQFAILSYKVKIILDNSKNCHDGMKELVLRHYRLIRLTEELENNFNIPIMQQLMGSTMHICISGYYSTNFGKAIYDYEWYNLPATEARFFLICMIRTQKPQCLTSGKFAILSLTNFTDILKTSMGYLSVLRTFV